MNIVVLVILGVLAAIGFLTLVAVYTVIKFGDESLTRIRSW